MALRYFEIAEEKNRILNPYTDSRLKKLGEVLDLSCQTKILDLGCGKGELLSSWAKAYDISGKGVDISSVFLTAAEKRAHELNIGDNLEFLLQPADELPSEPVYDIVSCLGVSWIGGGTQGTLEIMRRHLNPDGRNILVLGDIFWKEKPGPALIERTKADDYGWAVGLTGMNSKFEEAGWELIYMSISSQQDWDAYETQKWLCFRGWYDTHPDDPQRDELYAQHQQSRLDYLEFERPYCSWGIFVLKQARIEKQ